MASGPETRLQRRIQKALKKEVGGWWFKMWGGPFTPAGIPDLIGCVEGLFFALEVKLPIKKSKPSLIQIEVISDIIHKGGGVATIVRSPEEAVDVVLEALARTTERLQVRYQKKRHRAILRTASRKDIHYTGSVKKASWRSHEPENRKRSWK